MMMENGPMFLEGSGRNEGCKLLDIRLAYGHKGGRGGGTSSHDRGPNCRRETPLCSWPRPGPDVAICSAIVSSNVGIWVWKMAFSYAKTFLRHSGGGEHPLFPALIWRSSICFLILLHSWVKISWLHHRVSNHIWRIDDRSYSGIKEVGFINPKKYN